MMSDIIGHEKIQQFLTASFQNNRLHHAYLFLGPRSIGKMTMARAFIQVVLCEKKDEAPCGQCFACRAVVKGNHPDLTVLDGYQDSLGIEKARQLADMMSRSALMGQYRLGIIDGAHLLTTEAQNALLKTLEEPKPGKVLILVSEQPLLATILSRVQNVKFHLVRERAIKEFMQAQGADLETAGRLAALAQGRPGLALRFWRDQASQQDHEEKTRNFLSLFEGVGNFNTFATGLLGRDLDGARDKWNVLAEVGLRSLRSAALEKIGLSGHASVQAKEPLLNLSLNKIVFLMKELNHLRKAVSSNVDPRFALENFYLLIH